MTELSNSSTDGKNLRSSQVLSPWVVVLWSLSFLACSSHRFYAVEYGFYPRDVLPPVEGHQLRTEQLDVLAKARKVAFAPPSECKEIAVGSDRAAASVNLARTDCGALMSELEAAAQDAGFTVVSWRSIKEPVHLNAANHGVDLLIEVNRLDIPILEKKEFVPRTVHITEAFRDRSRKRISVDKLLSEVAPRCMERSPELDLGENKYGLIAILDAKVTDAHTGNIITRQVHMSPSASDQVGTMTHFFRGESQAQPEKVLCTDDEIGSDWQDEKKSRKPLNPDEDRGVGFNILIKRENDRGGVLPTLIQRVSRNLISRIVAIRDIYRTSPEYAETATAAETGHTGLTNGRGTAKVRSIKYTRRDRNEFAEQLNKAESLIDRSVFEEAKVILSQLVEKQSTNPRIHFLLGRICYMKNQEKDAISYLNASITLGLNDSRMVNQAKCWIRDYSGDPCGSN